MQVMKTKQPRKKTSRKILRRYIFWNPHIQLLRHAQVCIAKLFLTLKNLWSLCQAQESIQTTIPTEKNWIFLLCIETFFLWLALESLPYLFLSLPSSLLGILFFFNISKSQDNSGFRFSSSWPRYRLDFIFWENSVYLNEGGFQRKKVSRWIFSWGCQLFWTDFSVESDFSADRWIKTEMHWS